MCLIHGVSILSFFLPSFPLKRFDRINGRGRYLVRERGGRILAPWEPILWPRTNLFWLFRAKTPTPTRTVFLSILHSVVGCWVRQNKRLKRLVFCVCDCREKLPEIGKMENIE